MDQRIVRACKVQAEKFDLPLHHLLAFVEVESSGDAFDPVAGRDHALIRWEGHYFDRRLQSNKKALNEARSVKLAHPEVGGVKNPRGQTRRYEMLQAAAALCEKHDLNRDLAFECVSVGLGQVMAAHWRDLGYPSAEKMVEEAHNEFADKDIVDQIEMMMRYLDVNDLLDDVREGQWTTAARGYNGPGYAQNRYDTRMAAAAKRWAAVLGEGPAVPPTLNFGAQGSFVRVLQQKLAELGYAIGHVDGNYSTITRAAVLAFQADNNLATDGVAGPLTWEALEIADPRPLGDDRLTATAADLRREGSSTIRAADVAQIGGIGIGGAGGVSAVDKIAGDADTYVSGAERAAGLADRASGLLAVTSDMLGDIAPWVLLGIGGVIVWQCFRIKKARVEDHRAGANLSR